jgi:hypothetical protein
MTDINELVIQPLIRFYKDSAHLVKKCTKPDHRGKFVAHEAIPLLFTFYFS